MGAAAVGPRLRERNDDVRAGRVGLDPEIGVDGAGDLERGRNRLALEDENVASGLDGGPVPGTGAERHVLPRQERGARHGRHGIGGVVVDRRRGRIVIGRGRAEPAVRAQVPGVGLRALQRPFVLVSPAIRAHHEQAHRWPRRRLSPQHRGEELDLQAGEVEAGQRRLRPEVAVADRVSEYRMRPGTHDEALPVTRCGRGRFLAEARVVGEGSGQEDVVPARQMEAGHVQARPR